MLAIMAESWPKALEAERERRGWHQIRGARQSETTGLQGMAFHANETQTKFVLVGLGTRSPARSSWEDRL